MGDKLKIVILEGARGTGKSTLAHKWRQLVPETTLINPTGFHKTESSEEDLKQITSYYKSMMDMIFSQIYSGVKGTILFDRFFFTEQVFCELYKEYNFTDFYRRLMISLSGISDYVDIYVIHVTANTSTIANRLLSRDKVGYDDVKEDVKESLLQLSKYREVMKDVEEDMFYEFDNSNGTAEENLQKLLAITE